ncbi:ribosome biogenesis GTPase A [Eubacterium ruminantium]|uniref:Ribosome biogenesis GTPase A n=1 Tax=Eubacterium ruminantium TaxID=42322 RepID=A0A1T4M1F9_9FIRM|nr:MULTISPECIES: ribosome biogenesis GTPase YlqF [Eubacterium]MCR5367427.1 ribosome biogenesis GTPase YlqF [Eubacterium sp.]SCW37886.1 ribosome biogenesis GTPase A [Eubacterium ruminantium]SDM46009.1 ribosome biogenesis GTPase A [Eubacterium ruminantium]SJZ60725.1 ribosome biogenesis GTPase A [Eubacterium ruminantium]
MSDNKANINWFPGHMTKAVREMEQNIKLIDIVIEILDARIPFSSRNPIIDKLAKDKYRLLVFNKTDLADPALTKKWEEYYKEKGWVSVSMDSRKTKDARNITPIVMEICKEKLERDRRKGLLKRPIKSMIVGIPNVGKSTFINSYAGRASAKTGNKPGVTKGVQWIRLGNNLDLLDTPGVLWPKFDDKITGINLALIGSINDNILSKYDLALHLIDFLENNYCGIISKRYNIEEVKEGHEVLSSIADTRRCILKGGEPDIEKAATILIDDLRNGSLGKISLEEPSADKE